MALRPLVNPPIVLGPPGASPGPFANYHPPVIRIASAPTNGVKQVETATAAGTASATGVAEVTVTSENFPAPIVLPIAVTNADTATVVGGKIRAALLANAQILNYYTVGGSTTAASLTANTAKANDATLNIAIATGTATGVTAAATSANTTAGVFGTQGFLGQEAITPAGAVYKLKIENPPTWGTVTVS